MRHRPIRPLPSTGPEFLGEVAHEHKRSGFRRAVGRRGLRDKPARGRTHQDDVAARFSFIAGAKVLTVRNLLVRSALTVLRH